ncbi:hypothetical protein Slin_0634 [Spirosoma linguale DSM 74]|uniref:Uncharacterized protein n=1 Tax=Spirosoma linguale (strain ATCC 33905 / DSM 74 / LMG 10896 / Claus 1) TaxID=504472 RepID=D2QG90_SPILD|nr:hypothetical protein Slin_0634 [Spirosoma linguale DSM 74]
MEISDRVVSVNQDAEPLAIKHDGSAVYLYKRPYFIDESVNEV